MGVSSLHHKTYNAQGFFNLQNLSDFVVKRNKTVIVVDLAML